MIVDASDRNFDHVQATLPTFRIGEIIDPSLSIRASCRCLRAKSTSPYSKSEQLAPGQMNTCLASLSLQRAIHLTDPPGNFVRAQIIPFSSAVQLRRWRFWPFFTP
jgi:hypothetical protein